MTPRDDFQKPALAPGQAARVLLLEDDPISVEIVGTYLARIAAAAPEFHSAATLEQALALLSRTEVDLVISDLHLPDSSGAATVDALVKAVGCPVIAITSDMDAGLREATLACGAYEFMHKSELTEATLTRLVRLAVMQARSFRSLRESEARFRSLSALTADWLWETDAEHRFVTTPTGVTAVTGLGPDAYVGRPRWEVPGLAPVSGDWTAHRETLARHEAFRDLQLVQARAEGGPCYLQISGEPVYHADGGFKGYRGSAKDVTARNREEGLLRLEHAVAQSLATAPGAPQGIREVMQAVCEAEDWGCGRFFALDAAAGLMRFEEGWARPGGRFDGFLASSRAQTFAAGSGLVGKVWESGEPLWTRDASTDPRVAYRSLAREHAVHSVLAFPVTALERTVGVVSISSDSIREPDARLLGTLRVIGSQLGVFLQRCRAEVALRASEERFRQTFELAGSGMAHVSLDGRYLRVNRSLCRTLGYPEHELVGRAVKDISHPEDRDATDAARQQLRLGEADYIRAQKRYLRKDGATVWVDLTVALARDAHSNPLYEIAMLDDITDRKAAEAALRESEARFRTLTELTSDWYWEQDAELRFVSTGGATDLRAGITPQAHVGLRRWELPRTEIVGQSWDEHRRVLEARQPFTDLLLRRTSASGKAHFVSVAGQPVFDARGAFTGYRGVAKDVTGRMASELALRRFRAALDAAADPVLLVDPHTGTYLDFNEAACRAFGYTRAELLGMRTGEVRIDQPGAQLLEDYRELIEMRGESKVDIGLCRRKDGSTFPVEFTRRVVDTGEGPVVVANARDLTESLRAQKRQAAHLRYQERIARFGQSALAKREPAELVEEAAQTLLEALGADAVAYVEPGPTGEDVVLRTVLGVADATLDSRIVACSGADPLGQVLRSGQRRVVDGAELALAWAQRLRSAALVPVRGEPGVRGALCVLFAESGRFGADESLNFIQATASLLSTGLQRIDSEARLAHLAQFDQLTGLPNRTLLADRFSQMIVQAARRDAPLAVLFVDLDEFKMVNDTLGHAGGDALLKEVGARLRSTVRAGDTVARISGDEFAVVLAELARAEDAALVAHKIVERLSAAMEVHGKEVFVTASVGIAAYPADGADAEALIRAADAAMYRAKQSGRNAYQFFTPEINQRSRARAQMGAELRRALEREEFALAYQPKFQLATREASGAEALLRWQHPERGLVPPVEFIPVLEETGLIVPVGEWVVRRACADLKAWGAAGLSVGSVSVNLSARQFRQQELDKRIRALVAAAGVDAGQLELELTESQLMQDPDQAIVVMRALCDAGMRITIDDFGTGYSSLSYLRRFPVSALKIDRSFVKNMLDDAGDATIVRTIIEMAHSLRFSVVAEGVETEEQASFLRLLRCEQAQGFLFARPMPAEAMVRLLSRPRADLS